MLKYKKSGAHGVLNGLSRLRASSIFVLAFNVLLAAQETPTIRVPVRLVTAPTLVISKQGEFIRGLQNNSFRLYDNGRLQQVKVDEELSPLSVVLAVQTSQDVRQYLPFITKVGSTVDNLLLGETGEAAVITYNNQVKEIEAFADGNVSSALKSVTLGSEETHLYDAGIRAINLLRERSGLRSRVLLFIGQPTDSGSAATLELLKAHAELENVSIYALALPQFGKSFISDTFQIEGLSSKTHKGGVKVSAELTKLIPALKHSGEKKLGKDPFSLLAAATGGTQLPFRQQKQLEEGITTIGNQLRSLYLLSYSPDSTEAGYHEIRVEVDVPSAAVHARLGYELNSDELQDRGPAR